MCNNLIAIKKIKKTAEILCHQAFYTFQSTCDNTHKFKVIQRKAKTYLNFFQEAHAPFTVYWSKYAVENFSVNDF